MTHLWTNKTYYAKHYVLSTHYIMTYLSRKSMIVMSLACSSTSLRYRFCPLGLLYLIVSRHVNDMMTTNLVVGHHYHHHWRCLHTVYMIAGIINHHQTSDSWSFFIFLSSTFIKFIKSCRWKKYFVVIKNIFITEIKKVAKKKKFYKKKKIFFIKKKIIF